MSKKKLIRVLFLIILLQFGVYYPEFAKYLLDNIYLYIYARCIILIIKNNLLFFTNI